MWWCLSAALAAGPDVVLVGNSYTLYNGLDRVLTDQLTAVAAEGSSVEIAVLAGPGRTWVDHQGAVGDKDEYIAAFGAPRTHVVLQEQSQTPGFPEDDPAWLASRDAGVFLHQVARRAGAVTVLMQTWGRRDGDEANPALYPDFSTMQDRLTGGYAALAEAMAAASGEDVAIAPVGEAFRAVHAIAASSGDPLAEDSPFVRLYQRDGSHPSPTGTWLIGGVLTATLTGRSPRGAPDAVAAEDRERLQRVVEELVLSDPFEAGMPWAFTWAEWSAAMGEDAAVTGTWWTPLVRVDADAGARDGWTLGRIGEEGPGAGRVEVVDGGALTLTAILVVGEGGAGELRVRGGVLDVDRLALGLDATGAGAVSLEGGVLRVRSVELGEGEAALAWTGGALEGLEELPLSLTLGGPLAVGPDAHVGGDLRLAGQRLTLSEGVLDVDGVATLDGALVMDGAPEDGRVVLTAADVDASGVVLEGAPEGWGLEVTGEAGARQVRLVASGGAETPACACGGGGPAGAIVLIPVLLARRRRWS